MLGCLVWNTAPSAVVMVIDIQLADPAKGQARKGATPKRAAVGTRGRELLRRKPQKVKKS